MLADLDPGADTVHTRRVMSQDLAFAGRLGQPGLPGKKKEKEFKAYLNKAKSKRKKEKGSPERR